MSSSVLYNNVFQAKINNVQNQADTSAVYNGGIWSFKNSTAVTRVTITDAGNVGIGTASPATKLDVNGGAQITGSASGYSGGEMLLGGTGASLDSAVSTQASGSPAMFFDHRGTGNTGYFVWRAGTGGGTERMRIDASGNLLVGTAGVLGTSAAGSSHIVGGTNGDTTPLYLRNAVSTAGRYWKTGPSSTAAFIVYNDANNGAYLSYGGTSWIANSDQRMKKNIKPLELGLEQIKALKPARFDYNSDESEESSRVGFIAQEVLPVLPHAVSVPEDSEQMMGVSATEMIPVLVKAIQELSAQVEELKAKLP